MNFQVNLKDGTALNLAFSQYFLMRVGALTGLGLQDTFKYLIGDVIDMANGVVKGGVMDDIECRAHVIAAGLQAYGFANGDSKEYTAIDAFPMLEKIENVLANPIWAKMYIAIMTALMPTNLEPDVPKKKPVRQSQRKAAKPVLKR